jgi:hypothetical protein
MWLRRVGDGRLSSSVLRGLVVSIPVTAIAAWRFQTSLHRALTEFVFAVAALLLSLLFGWMVSAAEFPRILTGTSRSVRWGVVAAVVLIIVRQTMEIGAVLETAAVQVRSLDATAVVVAAVLLAGAAGWFWTRVGRNLPQSFLRASTRAFAFTLVAQLVLYSFHESTEARLLPYSEALHLATEPFGPDGVYGMHFSGLLILVPVLSVGWMSLRSHTSPGRLRQRRLFSQRRALPGIAVLSALILVCVQRNDAAQSRPDLSAGPAEIATLVARPHVLFRNTAAGKDFGRLSVAALESMDHRVVTSLVCERVSFSGGHGLCLHTDRGLFNSHKAFLFDRTLRAGASIKLQGLPSRTRIASPGTIGAITVFVVGEDYGGPFSTRTTIIDTGTGDEVGELEQFTTWRDGVRFRAADFNFWGVTFTPDGNTFFASLRTAGRTYLVRGELALRKLIVLREGVECPALSPNNRLLAYKKRVGPSPDSWRLHVLDLDANVERIVASETRYIDDQVEWLDAQNLLYAVPRRTTTVSDVWTASIDGSSPARVFLPEAESPVIVR